MQTVIFCGHPDLSESGSHQFMKAAVPKEIPFIEMAEHMDSAMIQAAQQQVLAAKRIFLQFPLYWYQAPGIVSNWITAVLTDDFLDNYHHHLQGKELGVLISIGVPLKHYRDGGREDVTLSELLSPYKTLAHALGMTYLPPFILEQHEYSTDRMKRYQLIAFKEHLDLPANPTFSQRSHWLVQQLQSIANEKGDNYPGLPLQLIADEWKERLDDLAMIERDLPKSSWR
ncbi:NAD(P)H-dependent oxidoreductase [Aerococcus suis]